MKMKKIFLTTLILLIIIVIASIALAKHVLPYAIIQPPRVSVPITPTDLNLNYTDHKIITQDSLKLNAYWIKSDSISPKSIIIFAHGIGGCKEHFLKTSKELTKLGIASVLVDSRAHGKSEGQFCTYGYKEKDDISKVVDFIKAKNDSIPIGIWGNSMGGAIVLQALEYDKRINFGIIESTFTNLKQIVYDYQKSFTYGIGFKLLCNIALEEAGRLAQFNPDLVAPISSVKQIQQPILIAHGEKDKRIKFSYGKQLYDSLLTTKKIFLPIKNGGHFNLGIQGGETYKNAIKNFITQYSKN